jgi:hypothetical protein
MPGTINTGAIVSRYFIQRESAEEARRRGMGEAEERPGETKNFVILGSYTCSCDLSNSGRASRISALVPTK